MKIRRPWVVTSTTGKGFAFTKSVRGTTDPGMVEPVEEVGRAAGTRLNFSAMFKYWATFHMLRDLCMADLPDLYPTLANVPLT